MAEKSKITNFADGFTSRIQSLNRKVVREGLQPSKLRMGRNNKEAGTIDIVDKYYKKELTDEYLEEMKKEYGITSKDITREIAKREIQKVLGR